MALQIHVTCSNHQKRDGTFGREQDIWVDSISDREAEIVKRHLERNGWVVQFNGAHMDTYCSKECAE